MTATTGVRSKGVACRWLAAVTGICALAGMASAAYASALTTGLWSTHAQSTTIRADLLINNQAHFIWPHSPLAQRTLVAVVLDGPRSNGVLLSDSPGVLYRDPEDAAREYILDMFISSHGHVRYEAIELIVSSNVPQRRLGATEGYVYTNFSIDAFYDRCVDNPNRGPLHVDNDGSTMDAHCITAMLHTISMADGRSLFSAATNGAVHEILYFGPHKAYQWEASMCGAYPLWINGGTATIPGSPHFVILACNTSRGVAEMIHNNHHRWENVAPNMYASTKNIGWKFGWSYSWDSSATPPYTELQRQALFTNQYNAWEQYSALYYALHTNINSVGQTLAGIGDCHYPVNVHAKLDGGYQYSSTRAGYSTYRYWRQPWLPLNANQAPDPRLGIGTNASVTTWRGEVRFGTSGTDDQRSFINWAYIAMPHGPGQHRNVTAQAVPGQTPNFIHNNWWVYFADHQQFLEPIRALRRAGQAMIVFRKAPWTNSTQVFMSNRWAELNLPRTMHTVTVVAHGNGHVAGTGTFLWGSSTLLTSAPPAALWIHNQTTNDATEWIPLLVTNDAVVHVFFDLPPVISPGALLFPAAGAAVMQDEPAHIRWDPLQITDNVDGTNCWILHFDVLRSNTLEVVQYVNPAISNAAGQHPWTPLASGHEYPNMFLMRIVAQDHAGNTSSNIMWNNPFYIIPEAPLWYAGGGVLLLWLRHV